MRVGRCCERDNGSSTSVQGKGPSRLTNARSGLVVVPHRVDRKLSGCLGSKTNWESVVEAQFSKVWPSLLVAL